ncbi:MAG TPA: crossover junction endodeoxyribonuclease RuvC [Candidatus Binataceae bacterium]|jgi:crossover junction endodeoxyribonuclease RuvC|nr:crossover junction endodeoxyribonuclease RuvC [Candidatus Binataceae bacterium]
MRVIGVDPGNVATGFGVIEGVPSKPVHIAAGTIRPPTALRGGPRLKSIHDRLLGLIDEYAPAAMSLERSFVAANVQSAFRLGEARAVAMLAAAERGLALYEYTPNDVKVTVAGYGHADKAQIGYMVRRTLALGDGVELDADAADALAIALCHLYRAPAQLMAAAAQASSRRRRALAGGAR